MKDNNLENLFYQYGLALEFLKVKFSSLNSDYFLLENNPVEHIKYRIKSYRSIEEKLLRKGVLASDTAIEESLNDVVGVRIVCSFFSDIQTIIDIIRNDPDLRIVEEKDYISKPKKSGYTSYHMIVKVPLFIRQETVTVKAEIQIRTIAMDMWASLEHKIWYKKNIKLPEVMKDEIKRAAKVCSMIDCELDEIVQSSSPTTAICGNSKQLFATINKQDFELFLLKYQVALQLLQQKIAVLYEGYGERDFCNPIEHVKSRIKEPSRIVQKLQRQHLEVNIENIERYIQDIAGLRIVCSFRSDLGELIQRLKDMIEIEPELELIMEKDYVTNPKKSGYSSYHMIIQMPIPLATGITYAKVELQLRTIAMDMWACLEHKLCYQKNVEQALQDELRNMATTIYTIDHRMDCIIQEARSTLIDSERVGKKKIRNLQK